MSLAEGRSPAPRQGAQAAPVRRSFLPPLPRDRWLAWLLREDVRGEGYAWDEVRGRRFRLWWLVHGRREYPGAAPPTPQEVARAFAPVPFHAGSRLVEVPAVLAELWAERSDLRAQYAGASEADIESLLRWFYLVGVRQCGLTDILPPAHQIAFRRLGQWLESDPNSAPLRRLLAGGAAAPAPAAALPIGRPQRRDGVNLVGFPRGQFGLGEDIRMAAAALGAAAVPFSVLAMKEQSDWRHRDPALDPHIREDAPFAINLLCGPGFEAAGWRLRLGDGLWRERHTIGWWPWELPRWPQCWQPAFELVDELWAASRYAREAYLPDCPVPLRLMPPAVAVDRLQPRSRASLGLPEGVFLFTFVFDGSSHLARKNPEAAVAAFREAFPGGGEPVGLVLKGMNAAAAPGWPDLALAAAADPRIRLIDGIWPREDVLALVGACDAVVSLHRAEGFGRHLAEAMLLEKPVVATGFSGNADFLTPATGFPVRFSPRRIGRGEYPFGDGQFWAEPDIAEAAAQMRRIAADPAAARPVALAGRDLIAERFSPEACGRNMRQRLLELGLEPRSPFPPQPPSKRASI